jgi:hypothetical protein
MREEHVRKDVRCELTQVVIVPRWLNAAKYTRRFPGVVPAEREPIAVGGLRAEPLVHALVDQRMDGRVKRGLDHHGRSRIGKPATHH